MQQPSLFNYAVERYNKDGDHDLKFISENLAKEPHTPLEKIHIPIPTDDVSVATNENSTYEINYEIIHYLNSNSEQSVDETKEEWVSHDEEEVIVEHGLLPNISHEIWSVYEVDYLSACIHMIFSDIEMTKE